MALVPLEARLESKERAWGEERNELIFKVGENQRSLGVVEERCRELEKRRSGMEHERRAVECLIFPSDPMKSLQCNAISVELYVILTLVKYQAEPIALR